MPPKKLKPISGFVIVVDVGPTTSALVSDTGTGKATFAETAKECLLSLIEQKIYFGIEDAVGVVLCGAEPTEQPLSINGKTMKNIKSLNYMKHANWELAKAVDQELRTTDCKADWVDALTVAVDLIHCEREAGVNYERTQILVLSPLKSTIQQPSKRIEAAYVAAMNGQGTEIYFIGSSVPPDDEAGVKMEKLELNESELFAKRLVEQVGGGFSSFGDLFSSVALLCDQPKIGAPWNIHLDIGPAVKIPLVGYIKVKDSDSLKWKEETVEEEGLVDKERTYQKGSGGTTTNLEKEDLMYGYKYGPTYEFLQSGVEERASKYPYGGKCLSVLAFVDPIPSHYHLGSGTMYFFAQKDKSNASVDRAALSAFINAMAEVGKVALVRRIYRSGTRARLGVLAPKIKLNFECLVYHELPFADDCRKFLLPPVVSTKHPPSDEQLKAIDDLIDSFDLMANAEETDINASEINDLQEEYTRRAVALKILHPQDPVPDIPTEVKANMQPMPSMLKAAKSAMERIKELFPLEVVDRLRVSGSEVSKRGAVPAAGNAEEEANTSKKPRLDDKGEVDLMAILGAEVVKIGTANPVEDFLALLKKKPVGEVYQEMEKVVVDLLRDSGGSNATLMEKSRRCLEAYRRHALDAGRAPEFNRWMERFKQEVLEGFFHDFWLRHVAEHRLGLITRDESEASSVKQEESEGFLKLPKKDDVSYEFPDDDQDLLDLI